MRFYREKHEGPKQIGIMLYWGWLMASFALFLGTTEVGIRWATISDENWLALVSRRYRVKREDANATKS